MASIRLSIGETARRFGVRTSALRYYERHGLLAPPRDAAGQRYYREQDLRDLAFVLMCRDGGLRLDDIATMMGRGPEPHRPWQHRAAERLAAIEAEIARLGTAREYLNTALRCTADHPAQTCPYVERELTERVARTLGDRA